MATSTHKKCSREGCKKQAWKKGLCYKDFYAEYPNEERPPSTYKPKKSTLQERVKEDIKKGHARAVATSLNDEINLLEKFRLLAKEYIRKEIEPEISAITQKLDDLQNGPVGEVVTTLAMIREDIEIIDRKLSGTYNES